MYRQVTGKEAGSIVLFHNNAKYTATALPSILDNLLRKDMNLSQYPNLFIKTAMI